MPQGLVEKKVGRNQSAYAECPLIERQRMLGVCVCVFAGWSILCKLLNYPEKWIDAGWRGFLLVQCAFDVDVFVANVGAHLRFSERKCEMFFGMYNMLHDLHS